MFVIEQIRHALGQIRIIHNFSQIQLPYDISLVFDHNRRIKGLGISIFHKDFLFVRALAHQKTAVCVTTRGQPLRDNRDCPAVLDSMRYQIHIDQLFDIGFLPKNCPQEQPLKRVAEILKNRKHSYQQAH